MTATPRYWPSNLTGKIAPEAELAVRQLFNTVQDHDAALSTLKAQLTASVVSQTTVNTTMTTTTAATTAIISTPLAAGVVNNQTGTTYTVQDSDYGGLVTFANAAGVAVTLNLTPRQYWTGAIENLGPGLVTLTPTTGTVNGMASLMLAANSGLLLYFDGVNWWAATPNVLVPRSTSAVAHQFFTSYNAATGLFLLAQPGEADVVNLVSDLALKAPLASPTFTGTVTQPTPAVLTGATTATSATAGTAFALPTAPAGYLQVKVNGVTVKLPYYGV